MIHCEDLYGSLGQSFCFVSLIYVCISYTHNILSILLVNSVTCLCIAWLVYSFRPTRVHGFGTRPSNRPTGVFKVPSPRFCNEVASPLEGWRQIGLNMKTSRARRGIETQEKNRILDESIFYGRIERREENKKQRNHLRNFPGFGPLFFRISVIWSQ